MDTENNILIKTRDLGEQEIKQEDVINFPNGLFAFENAKSFALLTPLGREASPMWLQCIEEVVPCFIVFNPHDLILDYNPVPDKEDMETIKAESIDDLDFLVLAVIPNDIRETTLNLKSPVIINRKNNLAVQTILSEDYDLKFPLYKDIREV